MSNRSTWFLHLLLLLSVHSVTPCTLSNRLLGVDSGTILPLGFQYDLTVTLDTTDEDLTESVIPALERAFAVQGSKQLIAACAPAGTDTTSFPDVVGWALGPPDTLVGMCNTNSATITTTTTTRCVKVQSQSNLYVESSAQNVPSFFYLLMTSLLPNFKANNIADKALVRIDNFKVVDSISGGPTMLRTSFPPSPSTTTVPVDASNKDDDVQTGDGNPSIDDDDDNVGGGQFASTIAPSGGGNGGSKEGATLGPSEIALAVGVFALPLALCFLILIICCCCCG